MTIKLSTVTFYSVPARGLVLFAGYKSNNSDKIKARVTSTIEAPTIATINVLLFAMRASSSFRLGSILKQTYINEAQIILTRACASI